MTTEENFEQLSHCQRLKAAVHHTTLRVCKESVEDKQIDINRIVVAAISETAWKRFETWAVDLEMFAKHGKRSTINADDVKMLIRKSPKLLEHINMLQDQMNASKVETKKKTKENKIPKDTLSYQKCMTKNLCVLL
ncbi:centromere protein S-like [Ruditapes philippinarum]|uniref:centromere protein S-like n=1 Tax=Ruditapes philippinarum TaxID=129788 RepID=UPI00295AF899|nr:centromere protein S-like [Ruditapes philippinarum]